MTTEFYKLMLITHRQAQPLHDYLQFIEICIKSGVTSVQLREKEAKPSFLEDFALKLQTLLAPYKIPLIINDNLELALKINAQGLHLGQSDGSPRWAREQLHPNQYLGLSIETENDLIRANSYTVDYVAASAVFPSVHKTNLRTIWGLEGLNALAQRSLNPLIAIGGINVTNVKQVMDAGAKGIAVIGALHNAPNPAAMTANLRQFIEREV
ncbi:MAG: thiamine phosphate synthase [Tatlockia sp.]|nr:thiamine phosphate synthase [Tatlockia sp.]